MLTKKLSEKLMVEEMDELIEIVEVVCSITQERIPERIAEQIAARTCREEQTVEAMKMIPQERVSKRIVKQIMAPACHKWQEQNVEDSQNHATSCEHEGPIEDCVSRQDPAANR